ncbi:AAA family ATPase [Gordonia iterans]
MSEDQNIPIVGRYTDIAGLLAGTLDPPAPEFLSRLDGHGLLYAAAVNGLFGEAESGKTWIALAAIAEELRARDGRCLFIDLDHNGAKSVVLRLLDMGVPESVLIDPARFRYTDPDEALEVHGAIADCEQWAPSLVVIDSVGELVPMFKGDSNSGDDYTSVHRKTAARLAKLGACVILIDHVAKSADSASRGAIGAGAKRRAVDGAYLRVTLRSPFTPGRGGSAVITVNKDRHGGVREHAHLDEGSKEPVAAIFEMTVAEGNMSWSVRAPLAADRIAETAPIADVLALASLDPEPQTLREVKARMRWGGTRAQAAFKALRNGEHLMVPGPEDHAGTADREPESGDGPRGPAPRVPDRGPRPDLHEYPDGPEMVPESRTTENSEDHGTCLVCGEPCKPTIARHVECVIAAQEVTE